MTSPVLVQRAGDEAAGVPDAPTRWRLERRPALDGLRGVGVLMVLFGHAGIVGPFRDLHVLGVEVFFVLSGFLITSLLLEEHARSGRIDLVAFYRRRAHRLIPALVLLLATVGAISVVTGTWDQSAVARGQLFGLLYTANIARALSIGLGPFEHLWSLAVEEHFYIVLPALLAIVLHVGRRGRLALAGATILGGIVASAVLRARWSADWARVYNGSDTRAGSLLVGCALALALHAGLHRTEISTRTKRILVAFAPAGLLVLAGIGAGTRQALLFELVLPLAAVLSAVIVATAALGDGRTVHLLSTRPLRWTGELSYGLYLWHAPIYLLVGDGAHTKLSVPMAFAGISLSFVAAMVSMALLESRFLTRRPEVLVAWQNLRRPA